MKCKNPINFLSNVCACVLDLEVDQASESDDFTTVFGSSVIISVEVLLIKRREISSFHEFYPKRSINWGFRDRKGSKRRLNFKFLFVNGRIGGKQEGAPF